MVSVNKTVREKNPPIKLQKKKSINQTAKKKSINETVEFLENSWDFSIPRIEKNPSNKVFC